MKLIIALFVFTFLKYSWCDEVVISQDVKDKCKDIIQTVFQESCDLSMHLRTMGFAMRGLKEGNDSRALEFCRLVPAGANCVLTGLSTQDDCKSWEPYQSKIMRARYDKLYSEYFCANDMQRLRDRSELDGMDCLYVNQFYRCKNQGNKLLRVQLTEKEEICRDIKLDIKCSVHFGQCENQKVRDIQLQLFQELAQGLECEIM